MIYNLKQLNKELIKETQQLSEKFIGIKGKLIKDGKQYYICGYNLQIMLDPQKITEYNINNLKGYDYFFGYLNQYHDIGRQILTRGAHKENFEDVYFTPIFHVGLPDLLKDKCHKIRKYVDVKDYVFERWKSNKQLNVAVICSKHSRVYPDLITGINHLRESKDLLSRFSLKCYNADYKQYRNSSNSKEYKSQINKLIQVLERVDKKYDLVTIIRGGCDRNMTCILDSQEIHAALLNMETPTICGVGHTKEHPEIKNYCDHHEETPSLLGVTLGTWAEEFWQNAGDRQTYETRL